MCCQLHEHPLVSVIVPAYNAQRYIPATLQSLICQSYPHLEIIVVDDGSTDQTAEIVNNFKQDDGRIQLYQQPNSGVAAARNLAIQYSKGSFIAPVDADDICYPEKIAKLLACLQVADNKVGVAYSWSAVLDSHGNPTGTGHMSEFEGNIFEYLLFSNFIGNASSSLIRKHCFERIGVYNTCFFLQAAQGCEDYDLYLRIAEQFEFRVVKEFLTGYRKTGNSMSRNHKTMEQSRNLVYNDQKRRNPWIPDIIFDWGFAYYYLWLSGIAMNNGYCYDSLKYLTRAAIYDKMIITNLTFLRRILSNIKKCVNNYLMFYFIKENRQNVILRSTVQSAPASNLPTLDMEYKYINVVKKDSLTILKEERRKTVYYFLRQIRIETGHYVNSNLSN
jgi:glycosyltransferase involved in cell wall biosynthesis